MASARYAYVNGEIVAFEDARVHISSAGFKFGTGVFEGIRGYWNESQEQLYLFRMDEHMRRLAFSQRFMRFEQTFSGDHVRERIVDLVRANELREDIHIMSTVYVSGFGGPDVCGPVDLAITTTPGVGPKLAQRGAHVQVTSWQRVPDNAMPVRVKCNANYHNGRMGLLQAKVDGYDACLFLNSRGKVAEGHGMCFFMIRDGRAVTPTVTSDILESITRLTVMQLLAEELGVEVVEREMDRTELAGADEAFFCGTAWEITPVVSVDRIAVGDGQVGPAVRDLQRVFGEVTRGTATRHAGWRLGIY
jgi:branched-chain amino acid aminotransferase